MRRRVRKVVDLAHFVRIAADSSSFVIETPESTDFERRSNVKPTEPRDMIARGHSLARDSVASVTVVLLMSAVAGSYASSAMAQSNGLRPLTVDAGHVVGRIKSLTGFTGSNANASEFAILKQMGVTTRRTHDMGAFDLMTASRTILR